MKTRLLKKWRKNWVISLEPAIFEDEKDQYSLRDWNKSKSGKKIVIGTLKDCLNYEHNILMNCLDKFEKKIKNNIYNRIN